MTAPATHQDTAITMEEIERQQVAAPAADLSQVKLEGEGIPSALAGKTAMDAIRHAAALEEALKISENARKQAELTAQTALRAPAPVAEAAPVAEIKPITREQFDELYQNDPMAAIQALNEQAIRMAERNLETRLGPLTSGSLSAAENGARTRYADEFALFSTEIKQVMEGFPNYRTVFANPAAWDDLISLVRGRPGNFEKLIAHKNQPNSEVLRREAINREASSMGYVDTNPIRSRSGGQVTELDATQREIADKLGMSHQDYIKWSNVNG